MKWIDHESDTTMFGSRAVASPTFDGVLNRQTPRPDYRCHFTADYLNLERATGEPLGFGDSFWLQDRNGDYLSTAYPTIKHGGGGMFVPQNQLDMLCDIGIAAYFARWGSGETATLAFVSQSPRSGSQVSDSDVVRIVSREPQLRSRCVLGQWAGGADCYYYDEYVGTGENVQRQAWTIKKVNPVSGPGICFGDSVHLATRHQTTSGST